MVYEYQSNEIKSESLTRKHNPAILKSSFTKSVLPETKPGTSSSSAYIADHWVTELVIKSSFSFPSQLNVSSYWTLLKENAYKLLFNSILPKPIQSSYFSKCQRLTFSPFQHCSHTVNDCVYFKHNNLPVFNRVETIKLNYNRRVQRFSK